MVAHINAGKLFCKTAYKREIEVGSSCTGCSQSTFFQRLHDLETIELQWELLFATWLGISPLWRWFFFFCRRSVPIASRLLSAYPKKSVNLPCPLLIFDNYNKTTSCSNLCLGTGLELSTPGMGKSSACHLNFANGCRIQRDIIFCLYELWNITSGFSG